MDREVSYARFHWKCWLNQLFAHVSNNSINFTDPYLVSDCTANINISFQWKTERKCRGRVVTHVDILNWTFPAIATLSTEMKKTKSFYWQAAMVTFFYAMALYVNVFLEHADDIFNALLLWDGYGIKP